MTTEVETVDLEFLLDSHRMVKNVLPLILSKRVGDTLVELCKQSDFFCPPRDRPMLGYSLEVNNFQVMFFPLEDRDKAWEAYERLIYALS
jgi:hypothetical protein